MQKLSPEQMKMARCGARVEITLEALDRLEYLEREIEMRDAADAVVLPQFVRLRDERDALRERVVELEAEVEALEGEIDALETEADDGDEVERDDGETNPAGGFKVGQRVRLILPNGFHESPRGGTRTGKVIKVTADSVVADSDDGLYSFSYHGEEVATLAAAQARGLTADEHAALSRVARELGDEPHARARVMTSLSWHGSPRFETWIARIVGADSPRAVAATADALSHELAAMVRL